MNKDSNLDFRDDYYNDIRSSETPEGEKGIKVLTYNYLMKLF
jgi:hypothetical protein